MSADELARRLQIWRMENDLTQKEAATVMQISVRSYQNWEQQVSVPSALALNSLIRTIDTWKRSKQHDHQG